MASASRPEARRTATAVAAGLRAGTCSAVEVAQDSMNRLEAMRTTTGGVAAIEPDLALADARRSDARLRAGTARTLEGVPITVKDWIDVAGWPVAGSAVMHRDRRPTRDATAVARLRAAGAVVCGITTALADSPAHGRTSNPRDVTRAPGGSSSGAAAVVAAGASPLALGSDSGGSIRLPAAWCGVCGLKPSFGRVPLTGHFPRLGSLSDGRTVIGPLANAVDDLDLVLRCIAGPDDLDAGTIPVALGDAARVEVESLTIGMMQHGSPSHVIDALTHLRAAGATIVDDALPDVRDEALEITRRYWKRSGASGADNDAMLWDWDRFARRMLQATAGLDAVIVPATQTSAPPWREAIDTDYIWQLPWSLTGAPAVVIPTGIDADGLPVCVQVVSRRWHDHIVLAVARHLEQSRASPSGRVPSSAS